MPTLYTVSYPDVSPQASAFMQAFRREHDLPYRDVVDAHFTMVFGCKTIDLQEYRKHIAAIATFRTELLARISQAHERMTQAQRRLWNAIRISPEKWQLHPYGDVGGGFWTVGLIGRTVIWYNDVENGFNRSLYSAYGLIDDYWRNEDELDVTIQYLANALSLGQDLLQLWSQYKKRAR